MDVLHRKRRRSYDDRSHAHFVTYSCFKRLPLLSKDRTRQWTIDAMASARRKLNFALWAYCIMPEHVHLLIYPRDVRSTMRHTLAALKRSVAGQAKQYLKDIHAWDWLDRLTVRSGKRQVFRFWQPGGGFDANIWRERTIEEVIDYIHANPVRRGLVQRAIDWEWSSARFWGGIRPVRLEMDPFL